MLETMLAVMDELARRGVTVATLEYPGFILIARGAGRGVLAYGEANPTWGCDVYDDAEMLQPIEYIESTIARDSVDVVAIADFVVFVAVSAGVEFTGPATVPVVEVKHYGA